ncbi:MAG: hypothetical protein JRD05_05190 [Deltaproteobacteria bacterium]|nr:hypothetical protein [Deltaproteobacteria bacterium]
MGIGVMVLFGRDFTNGRGLENRFEKTGKGEGRRERQARLRLTGYAVAVFALSKKVNSLF